ncbi:hypothetical protein C0J50_19922 [Silurus asotus]|uniref:Uncharacterized protein n=1 Tax=Silurus asotus TaxID=30991 RepID=A0AAD5FKH0_SILAS|nr:hypothetical protein C0J50_19922 [Silurus asotus]
MRRHRRRELPDKQNALNKFDSHMKARVKSCNSGLSAPSHTSVCSKNKTDEHFSAPQKTKRLKTIKQRNHIRAQSNIRSKQSLPQCKKGSIDKQPGSESQDCQCIRLLTFSKKVKPGAKPFPLQKPSIITEGRLTSIRGLFSHEVRSVDIERLVKKRKQEGKATASNSSSLSGVIPHSTPAVISETSEEGSPAHANGGQQPKTLEKAEELQINLEDTVPVDGMHSFGQTNKATDKTARSESPSGIQEAVILSLSESEPIHKSFPTSVKDICLIDHYVSPKTKNTHDQKQAYKTPPVVDVQPAERLDSPAGSEVLYSNAQQFEQSPAIFTFSSPTMGRERCSFEREASHRKHILSSKKEAVSRLAARLCRNLVSVPPQRCCHLLTKCKQVLLHQLKETHGSRLQHNLHKLHSHLSTEAPHSPHTADQVWPSSVQQYLDSPQMYFSCTGKYEDVQPRDTMNFQKVNRSQKHLREEFCEDVEGGAAFKRQSRQTWGIYSPQDYVTELQGQDTLSQWSKPAQHTSKSQTFSKHQAFTGPHTSTLWPNNCTERLLNPFNLEPQKQVKLGSDESQKRQSTSLPLLEQWRNDPDLNFLFQEENLTRSHASVGTPTEPRMRSPQHHIQRVSERPLFSAASAFSPFFPPEGFCYEPYYRFPHPSNSFSRSEKSGMTLYTQLDDEKRGPCPSMRSTTSYF